MKRLIAVLGIFVAIMASTANAQPLKQPELNWFEQIFQTLTGTQTTTENPKTTPTTIKKHHHHKHGHRHASTTHKSHASAGVTKSHAPTAANQKLFEEFKEWHDRQELYKLFNPIQHEKPQ